MMHLCIMFYMYWTPLSRLFQNLVLLFQLSLTNARALTLLSLSKLQNAPIVFEWIGFRPHREPLRVERELLQFSSGSLQVSFEIFTLAVVLQASNYLLGVYYHQINWFPKII